MSLVFYLIHPRSYGSPLGGQVDVGNQSVRLDGVELATAAALGEAASSTIEIEDPQGIYTPTALWFFRMDENSYASNTMLYTGIVGDRTARRDKDRALINGASRLWTLDLSELDAAMGYRMVTDEDADRPAETAGARLTWLLADGYAPFHDHGNVTYPTNPMDATDYRGRYFRDVLADLALVSGYNFWTDVRQSDGQVSLFFFDANTSTDYGTPLRISNLVSDVTGDATGWTYYPSTDGELKRSGARVASGVDLPYSGGNVYVSSAATASNFGFRDLTAPMATVSSSSKATALANRFLGESNSEDDTIVVTVRLPIAAVKMVRKGHRMQARFQHLDGWESWRWARIKRLTIIQDQGTVETLRLRLELTPQAAIVPVDELQGGISLTGLGTTGWWETTGSVHVAAWTTSGAVGDASDFTVVNSWDNPRSPFGFFGYSGIQCDKDGTVDVYYRMSAATVAGAPSKTVTATILKNGSVIATNAETRTTSGLVAFNPVITVEAAGVSVVAGDIIEGRITWTGGGTGLTVPSGAGQNGEQLTVTAA